MAWDKDLPNDSGKIREGPSEIRANNAAVEQADISLKQWAVNLLDRTDAAVTGPNDPTRADNVMFLYSKDDGSNTELFLEDDQNPANVIQMSRTVDLNDAANDGSTFLPGGLVMKWGKESTVTFGADRTVTYGIPFTTATYTVTLTAISGGTLSRVDLSIFGSPTATDFVIKNNANGIPTDVYWVAIGK